MRSRANVEYYDSVTSTNDVARKKIASGVPEWTVVTAGIQTAGKGSRGRKWISPKGSNLLASVVLYPNVPFVRTVEMSFVASVAVAEALRALGLDARIKWPNDVLVSGKKICGILIESVTRAGEMPAVIVGIGVNVNWKDLDPEITKTATSVVLELGKPVDVDEVLRLLLDNFETLYESYLQNGLSGIMLIWREMQCTIGRNVNVLMEGQVIKGKAVGVDDSGGLVVDTGSGMVTVTAAGTLLPEDHTEGPE